MDFHESMLDLIGNTPLVRLNSLTRELTDVAGVAPTILAKVEIFNPGGSVKDRIGLRMVLAAERDGRLRPGGIIVEPTSGNTGIGLALVAQQKGYRCIFTCPDKVSADKIAVLRAYGAEVIICPSTVPPTHPEFYRNVSVRIASETPGACLLDQYSNAENPASHYHSTGPEIWRQTDGRITHFVAGVGTGGTISGVGRYLKEVSDGRVRIIGADPEGSIYSSQGVPVRPYLVEGVGQPSLPRSFDPAVPDEIIAISDRDSILTTRELAQQDGILTGGSGGMAVAACREVARRAASDAVIVVLIPDNGRGYLSKIFDDGWVTRYGFVAPAGIGPRVGDVLAHLPIDRPLMVVDPIETVASAIKIMRSVDADRLPVASARTPIRLAEVLGTVSASALVLGLTSGTLQLSDPVSTAVEPVMQLVGREELLATALPTIVSGTAALVLDCGSPIALITVNDVLTFLGTN